MEDEVAGRTADQQLVIKTISARLVQLYLDADRLLRDAEGVAAQYRQVAEELADVCRKAVVLLQVAPKSQFSVTVLRTALSGANIMIPVLQQRVKNWDAFVRIREGAKIELNNLRKLLDEVLTKPRRSINDVKRDFDVVSEKRRKTSNVNNKVRQSQQIPGLFHPLDSAYADVGFFDVGAQQMEKYDEALNEMSAEIEDENLFCDAVDHFNAELKPICDLLSREPNQDNIRHVEKFQLPTLRTELAMLKKKYDEAYHVRRYVNPDSSRIAAIEDRMKILGSMLEDVKKAEQKRIMVMVTERLSQLKTIPVLEVTQDSLDEMENQLQILPKEQADELQRQIENLRNAKKRHLNFIHGTVLTHVEDATTSFPTQDTPQQNYSRVKVCWRIHLKRALCLRVAQRGLLNVPNHNVCKKVKQRLIKMEDEVAGRTADRHLTDAIEFISKRLAQLYVDCDRLLNDAGGEPIRSRPTAEELLDECKKAVALLQDAPKSLPSVQALEAVLFPAQMMFAELQREVNFWDAFVQIKQITKSNFDKWRMLLDKVLAKPRRSIKDERGFDVISEERKRTDVCDVYYYMSELRQLNELLHPLKSAHAEFQFIDEALHEMSAEIADENLLCDTIEHFHTEMISIYHLLSKEDNQEIIKDVEKFQLPALREQLAMLKGKFEEANHARKHVDPDSSRFAALEDRLKTLDLMLEDAKKAFEKDEQKRIFVGITERLSQLKTIPILELTEDSLNEMENQIQTLPKDQADKLQKEIEDLRNAKKRHFDFIHGTVLTYAEDATAAFSTARDIPQENSFRVKNSSKLTMDVTCHSASNCVRSLKVEIQVRNGPLGEALLTYSDAGYCVAKQKFCGFEWEFKPTVNEDHVSITLWCNPEVESDSWRCATLITVYGCAGVDGESTLLYRSSHIFHNEFRSTSIIIPRVELDNDGTLGILNTSGCSREAAMPDSKFTKPSEFSNACIAFKNSDMRVFVNKEYLLINSRKFATLFTPERPGSAASNLDKSETGDDFDVLSSRASVPGQSLEDDSGPNTLLSSRGGDVPTVVCHEEGVFLLEDINIKDFITFLGTIYPPFNDITGENVESVLPTAFRFDVEHIVKKCEIYLGSEDARKLFDLFQRLVFATTYNMSSLQKDSLALLQNARDVLSLLDDPRLQNVSSDLRSILLETLLERFRSEARTTSEADEASTASDF
ncbi:unnamed protein product [Cylicocyclus nassatus]|uniref:BTB domain-containing protein n=1 Tax=Cylicocyclus nassatus TaxID=53992 RepID=A0AA36DUV0_CYLNA|nr:unnamed protein product [Cylicocyclus nassatus]